MLSSFSGADAYLRIYNSANLTGLPTGALLRVSGLMTGQVIAANSTNWVDDYQANEQKIYLVEELANSSSRFWDRYTEQ